MTGSTRDNLDSGSQRALSALVAAEGGFTLIELVVVIGIAVILLSLATMQFSSMTSSRYIEKEARQLLADLDTARTQAIFSKRPTAVRFPDSSSYSFVTYSSANEAVGAGTVLRTTNVKVPLAVVDGSANGSSIAGQAAVFSREGNAYHADAVTVWSPPLIVWVVSKGQEVPADSVVIDTARTSIGRTINGICSIQ